MSEEIQNNQDFNYQQIGTEPVQEGLRSIGQLFKDSFSLLKSNFLRLFTIIGVAILFNIFIGILAGLTISTLIISTSVDVYVGIIFITFLYVLFLIIFNISVEIAIIYAIHNKNVRISECFTFAFKKVLSYLGFNMTQGFLIILIPLLLFIPLTLFFIQFFNLGIVVTIYSLAIFALFFFIPVFVFYIWFIIARYIFILDNNGIFTSISKSREYIRGYGWKTFWRFVPIFIMYIIPYLIMFGLMFFGNTDVSLYKNSLLTMNLIFSLYGIFVMIFSLIYLYLIYSDFQKIKPELKISSTKKYKIGFIIAVIFIFIDIVFIISWLPSILYQKIKNYMILQPIITNNQNTTLPNKMLPYNINKVEDTKRAGELAQLQYSIISYRIEKGQIPDNLDELKQFLVEKKEVSLVDAIDEGIFYYKKLSKDDFELCVKQLTREDKCVTSKF